MEGGLRAVVLHAAIAVALPLPAQDSAAAPTAHPLPKCHALPVFQITPCRAALSSLLSQHEPILKYVCYCCCDLYACYFCLLSSLCLLILASLKWLHTVFQQQLTLFQQLLAYTSRSLLWIHADHVIDVTAPVTDLLDCIQRLLLLLLQTLPVRTALWPILKRNAQPSRALGTLNCNIKCHTATLATHNTTCCSFLRQVGSMRQAISHSALSLLTGGFLAGGLYGMTASMS